MMSMYKAPSQYRRGKYSRDIKYRRTNLKQIKSYQGQSRINAMDDLNLQVLVVIAATSLVFGKPTLSS
jgi:hypothetical protein